MLRPGGRAAYTVVYIPRGLSNRKRAQALDVGPPEVASRRTPSQMLEDAGFTHVVESDLTSDYLAVSRGTVEVRKRFADELRVEEGEQTFEEENAKRERVAWAIEHGLLRRSLLAGVSLAASKRAELVGASELEQVLDHVSLIPVSPSPRRSAGAPATGRRRLVCPILAVRERWLGALESTPR